MMDAFFKKRHSAWAPIFIAALGNIDHLHGLRDDILARCAAYNSIKTNESDSSKKYGTYMYNLSIFEGGSFRVFYGLLDK